MQHTPAHPRGSRRRRLLVRVATALLPALTCSGILMSTGLTPVAPGNTGSTAPVVDLVVSGP